MAIYDYRIVLTHNQPDGSLVNVESISVPNTVLSLEDVLTHYDLADNTHYLVRGGDTTDPLVTTSAATSAQNGYTKKEWVFLLVSDVALQYWIDTYRGQKVTVRTTLRKYNQYEDWNATIGPEELDANNAEYMQGTWWYSNVRVPLYLQGTQP